MRPFPSIASLEFHIDRRHGFRIKHVYAGRHDVVLGVIGHLASLEQVSAIDLYGRELVGPGANQKWLLAQKRINHLPRILVGFEERSVHARIAELDDYRYRRRRLSRYKRGKYNWYENEESNSAEKRMADLNHAVSPTGI